VDSYAFPIASRREPANRVVGARPAPTRRYGAVVTRCASVRYAPRSIVLECRAAMPSAPTLIERFTGGPARPFTGAARLGGCVSASD
jgi:hypothetical protein